MLPAETAITSVRPLTCTGALTLGEKLTPTWPKLFEPQAQTVPSVFSASVWPSVGLLPPLLLPPAETARTPPKFPPTTTSKSAVTALLFGFGSCQKFVAVARTGSELLGG